jgi:hypothetical protein
VFVNYFIFEVSNVFAQSGKPLFPKTPGVQAYTYRNSFKNGVPETLDTIRALGLQKLKVAQILMG